MPLMLIARIYSTLACSPQGSEQLTLWLLLQSQPHLLSSSTPPVLREYVSGQQAGQMSLTYHPGNLYLWFCGEGLRGKETGQDTHGWALGYAVSPLISVITVCVSLGEKGVYVTTSLERHGQAWSQSLWLNLTCAGAF